MKIKVKLESSFMSNRIFLKTDNREHTLLIPVKDSGYGSEANGGELLFLALAACFCNDIYREAGKQKIKISGVSVTVEGDFGKEGEPASSISYRAEIDSSLQDENKISEFLRYVDSVSEIQNTIRKGATVKLIF